MPRNLKRYTGRKDLRFITFIFSMAPTKAASRLEECRSFKVTRRLLSS
jgi:hypothetical protein